MARPRTTPTTNTPQAQLAARLVQARLAVGLTQEECAKCIAISRPRYAAFEEGRNPVRWDIALRFCRQLIISEYWLATGNGDMREYHDIDSSPLRDSIPIEAPYLDAFESLLFSAYLHRHNATLSISGINFRALGSDTPNLYSRLFRAVFEQWKKRMPSGRESHAMALLLQQLRRIEDKMREAGPVKQEKSVEATEQVKGTRALRETGEMPKQLLTYSGSIDIPSGRYEQTTPVNMQKNHIATRIKKARKQLGLSQREAAEKWGFPVQTIQQWEHGRREPRALYAEKIESILAEIERAGKKYRP